MSHSDLGEEVREKHCRENWKGKGPQVKRRMALSRDRETAR